MGHHFQVSLKHTGETLTQLDSFVLCTINHINKSVTDILYVHFFFFFFTFYKGVGFKQEQDQKGIAWVLKRI